MKVFRNIISPIVGIVVYFIVVTIGMFAVDYVASGAYSLIVNVHEQNPYNPTVQLIGMAVVRIIAIMFAAATSNKVCIPLKNGFLIGPFVYGLIVFAFASTSLLSLIPATFSEPSLKHIVCLIEEISKAFLAITFIISGIKGEDLEII